MFAYILTEEAWLLRASRLHSPAVGRMNNMEYILHIGLHKTGTTSIQAFLQRNNAALQNKGVGFYQGMVFPENHVELHAASIRPERQSGYKNRTGLIVEHLYIEEVRQRVMQFVAASDARRLIFSNEGLSLLRYVDELEMLKSLFPTGTFKVVVYLRNVADYLHAYEAQLHKNPETLPQQIDKDSFAYTEPDTWLRDYSARLEPFQQVFGSANVLVQDYDQAMGSYGNVIPSFLRLLGLQEAFETKDWENCFLNRTPAATGT